MFCKFSELASCESWQSYFDGFHNPTFLWGSGLFTVARRLVSMLKRLELVPTDADASW